MLTALPLSPFLTLALLPSLSQTLISSLQNPQETSETLINREVISQFVSDLSSSGLGLV